MFKKVLIANRGEIALRVIRALKELGIKSVAVHSEADRESLHVKMADESVCIGPPSSRESYLAIPRLLSAAEITGADAVHPGYGFLAENAEFARVCEKCGLTFIGPTPEQIEMMGDKLRARETAERIGLPLLRGIEIDLENQSVLRESLESIGFPLIVKATAGGGGKGIKIIRSMDEAWNTLRTAQSEALAAFGNAKVYVEKYLEKARHIEFQVAGDSFGNVVHFGERDCSIQRRYQKVLEEAPSPAVTTEIRKKMGSLVVKAIREVGYRNVGTLEFLMDADKSFYFLEMNTRVQVEHPITEEITNTDLVKLQLLIASGEKLPMTQDEITFSGHAIEMRINAEDPEKFYPSAGQISAYHTPGGKGVRIESGVYDGFTVSPYYDSLLAKLIVKGASRAEAIVRAEAALDEFLVEGIHTNIPLHRKILSNQEFLNGNTHIRFIDNILK